MKLIVIHHHHHWPLPNASAYPDKWIWRVVLTARWSVNILLVFAVPTEFVSGWRFLEAISISLSDTFRLGLAFPAANSHSMVLNTIWQCDITTRILLLLWCIYDSIFVIRLRRRMHRSIDSWCDIIILQHRREIREFDWSCGHFLKYLMRVLYLSVSWWSNMWEWESFVDIVSSVEPFWKGDIIFVFNVFGMK